MCNFTQTELYDTIQQYVQNQDAILAEARAAVVQWRYADEKMLGLFPLFSEIGFQGCDKWETPKRTWLQSKPDGICYEHGIDAHGRVRLIQRGKLTTLFMYSEQVVDEMNYRDREAAPRALCRHLLEHGRVVGVYEYCLSPHQYSFDAYEFGDDKLAKSIQQAWYVSDGKWVEATCTTICDYVHDSVGLLRVCRDMGESLGGRSLIFVRPGSGRLKNSKTTRRPFVAYTIEIDPNTDDAEHQIYCDAYGLEMNIDDEWSVDTVLLTRPDLVHVIIDDTDVTSMGTVYAGTSSTPPVGDLRKLKDAGATWILLSADDSAFATKASAVLDADLNLILSVTDVQEISTALANCDGVDDSRLVIAFRPDGDCAPKAAQKTASEIRQRLTEYRYDGSRVILASRIGNDDPIEYLTQPDIDGVLYDDGNFGSALEVLIMIALHSA